METTRRTFLAGLGASLVAKALPFAVPGSLARSLPEIRLSAGLSPDYLTFDFLHRAIADLYRQVDALDRYSPNEAERAIMAQQIDAALYNIRPAGVVIRVETSFDNMIAGNFSIVEEGPGTVIIL